MMGTGRAESRAATLSVDFEVRGEIQGLYYLKCCKEEASKLGISGWVKHDRKGTIVGMVQGPKLGVEQMIFWLSSKGSPGTRIHDCDLYNYRFISRPEYRGFSTRL